MKKIFLILSLFVCTNFSFGFNVTIIESESFNAGQIMDSVWYGVCVSMGYTATIMPQTTLDNNTFFATTDLLIVSSGVIALPNNRILTIQQFLQTGKPAYIQAEYLDTYGGDIAFQTIVNNLGGVFAWGGTTNGDLAPMNVLGTFATTNNAVASISYYWYGCFGTGNCTIENMLEYQGQYFGFQFCPPNSGVGELSTTSDQDWVNQSTSLPLMQNIITNLVTPGLCAINGSGPVVNLGPDTTLCQGQSLTLNATNVNSTYLWNNNTTNATLTVTVSGTYYVAVTNSCGTGYDTIVVTFNAPPTVNLGNDTTICSPNTLTLNAGNAGATYLWSTGANTQTITVSITGNYWVTASVGSCSASDTISVTINNGPTVTLGNDTTLCNGQPISLNAGNPGDTYLWSTGANTQTISPVVSGTYSVTVSSGNCTSSDSITVTFSAPPTVHLGNDTTLCSPGNLTLNAGNAGATYLWSTGANTQTINVTTTGNYWVVVSFGNCSGADTISVTFNPPPVVALGNDTTLCSGQPITLNAGNAGDTYLWSNGDVTQTISPTLSGAYSVTVSAGSCTANGTINVTFTPLPIVNLGPDQNLCNVPNVTLNAGNPGDTYLWSTGANTQTITVSTAGQYWVTVNNGTCAGSDTVNISFGNSVTVNLGHDVTICPGVSEVLNAGNAGMQYHWSTGDTTQTISVNTTGTYWVNVSNVGCEGSDTITVKVSPQPIVSLGDDTAICPGDQFVINAGKGFEGYSWTPGGESSAIIIVNQPGTYAVTITDSNGCTASSSIWLKQFCASDMYIPSGFNPGGSINYVFLPVCENVVDYQLYIYDRWGQLLFQSEDISTGWDGTFNSNAAPQGVYVYRIDYKLYDYDQLMKHTKTGTVTLIR